LERLVQQRTQELAEAHTTKDKVISLVSHEMKEPVARLKSVTQLLRQKLSNAALSEIVQQIFAEIETSIERTEHLVQELLETSDIETQRFIMHRQQRDLVQLCQKVLDEELPRINQRFVICEVQGPLYVEVDEEQIFQVLRLLIDSTQASSSDLDTAVTITLQQSNQEAILSLRDEGSRVGLGAGLYISRKIVERHGGHLEIQSFPENRRSIFVSLPLFQGSAAQSTQTVQTVFDEQQDEVIALVPQIMATWVIASSKNRVSLDS
jgi:signal transduction histidine kinase